MTRTEAIRDIEQLEEMLSDPAPAVVEAMGRLEGDLILLGVGGKMGPTLARMARRASDLAGVRRRVIGVSRFSSSQLPAQLQAHGVEALRCDLLDLDQVARLPDAANVLAMTGMKFGSTGQESMTWAMNAWLPSGICQRYRGSRIVAFSTGNVYGLTPVRYGGSRESDALQPVGEYAMSCLGRERMYEYFSRTWKIPMTLLRLNYACELRYGVLMDIAQKVWNRQPLDVAMGHLNAIWQADANGMALQSFDVCASPPRVVNLAGPELLSVRRLGEELGALLDRAVTITGQEQEAAFLSNGQLGHRLFGYPRFGVRQMLEWTADWIRRGGPTLGKPTHFEASDGKY